MNDLEKDQTTMGTGNEDKERSGETVVVSERLPVRLGMVAIVVSALLGGAWYLASALTKIETKLDSISVQLSGAVTSTIGLERRQNEHEQEDQREWTNAKTQLSVLNETGGKKVLELERQLNDLRNDFRVHIATQKPQ